MVRVNAQAALVIANTIILTEGLAYAPLTMEALFWGRQMLFMNFFRSVLSGVAAIFIGLPSITFADDGLPYPQFDGIYIKMNDGSYVEVPTRSIKANKGISFQSGGMNSSELFREYYGIDDMASLPIIDLDNAGPVVIIGPPPDDVAVSSMVDTSLYFSEYLKDPSATATFNDGTKKSQMRASDAPSLFTAGGCAPPIKIRRVESFITEIYPDTASGKWPKDTTKSDKSRGCVGFGRNAVAFEIIIRGRPTAWFLSEDGDSNRASNDSNPPKRSTKSSAFHNELGQDPSNFTTIFVD
jgi:hypothetical protein